MKKEEWQQYFNKIKDYNELDLNCGLFELSRKRIEGEIISDDTFVMNLYHFINGLAEHQINDDMAKFICKNLYSSIFIRKRLSSYNLDILIKYSIINNMPYAFNVLMDSYIKKDNNFFSKYKNYVDEVIRKNGINSLSFLEKLSPAFFDEFFIPEYIKNLEHMESGALINLMINQRLSDDCIKSFYFIKAFKEYDVTSKLFILYILREKDYPDSIQELIENYITMDDYNSGNNIEKYFKMHICEFTYKMYEIMTSSFVRKKLYDKEDEMVIDYFKIIMDKTGNSDDNKIEYKTIGIELLENIEVNPLYDYHSGMLRLYDKVVDYSKESIINNLFCIDKLPSLINYMPLDEKYSILVENNDDSDNYIIDEEFKIEQEVFSKYTIITQDNFTINEELVGKCVINGGMQTPVYNVYAYGNNIRKEDIIYICPARRIKIFNCQNRCQIELHDLSMTENNSKNFLSHNKAIWFDIEDFIQYTYYNQTEGTIVIRNRNDFKPKAVLDLDNFTNGNSTLCSDGSVIENSKNVEIVEDILEKYSEDVLDNIKSKNLKVLKLTASHNTIIGASPIVSHHLG